MRDPQEIAMLIFALVIAIPIHEFAHALSAVNNGDDGPRRDGRLTIMPWDHFDVLGGAFCVISAVTGAGLGWGKPVMVNPGVLNNPKWDMLKIAAWGPLSNLLLAIGFSLPLRFGLVDEAFIPLMLVCLRVNLGLMLFNLIPIGPLDGAKVVVAFLPDNQAFEFSRFMERYGMFMLLGLVMVGQGLLLYLVHIPRIAIERVLLGIG